MLSNESIAIVGCYHSLNSGVMAMAESVIQKNLDKTVYVFSSSKFYKDDVERYSIYSNVQIHIPAWRGVGKWGKIANYAMMLFGLLIDSKTRKIVQDCSAVYDISGDSISNDYGDLNALLQVLPSYSIGSTSNNLHLTPQTMGPFSAWWLKAYVKKLFKVATTAYLREKKSQDFLSPIGVYCEVKPDLANSLKAREIIVPFNLRNKTVGVGVSSLIQRYGSGSGGIFKDIIDSALEKNFQVLLINHVTFPSSNDLEVARVLKSTFYAENDSVIFTGENYRASEWKYLLSQCACVISARMHPVVLALSSNVPSLNLSYNHKSLGVVKEAYFPLGDVVDFKNSDELALKVGKLLRMASND